MVATRRGVRVSPPRNPDSDLASAAQATPLTSRTPSTGRRTRSRAKSPESPKQSTVEEATSQLQKLSEDGSPPASARKRCTRASRLHSPEKPCTPVSSVHEGDISELESCCSAVSDIEMPVTRRSTRRPPRTAGKEEDVSEVESCSSVVSASKVRRSTRKKPVSGASDSGEVKEDKTESKPRRKCVTRAASQRQLEDSDVSDADSVSENVSRPTTRRSTRVRTKPDGDDALEGSQSPARTTRTTRATRSKAETASDAPVSCDSEGFESGLRYSRAARSRRRASQVKVLDSDSDLTDVGKGTPSSSRTGSGSTSTKGQASEVLPKDLSIVLEKAIVLSDQEESMDDSRLESTVVENDAECTMIEENEEKDGNILTETNQKNEYVSEKLPAADEAAVIKEGHQEEPSPEHMVESASEMEMMQETVQAPEASVTTAHDSQTPDNSNEDMEVATADTDIIDNSQQDEEDDEDVDVEVTEGGQTEARSVSGEAQQVVESFQDQEEPIQATSSRTTAEQPPQGAVASKSAISLLDSSEDEEEEEDDFADEIRVSSGDEEVQDLETNEEAGQSTKTEVTQSVDGLFMIDTRPGQEADEQYYQDGLREKDEAAEEEDEEFVDEEGDSGDDAAADVLFSSRNPQVKELSSRIDPGIRIKELGGLYISFDGSKSKPVSSSQHKTKEKKIQDEVMKKSVIGPDFEKKEAVPPYRESKHALKLKHRAEREKTTGDAWFNMKAPEITPELKGDLQLLKMRGSMDSKRFYKKNDRDGFPKYFQMGTVVDSPVDFYHSRVSKKDRKRTMVEELLADAEFRQKNKKKFQAIMAEKAAQAAGRRHKKKNKFHNKK